MTSSDTLFASPLGDIEKFRFNQAVVAVFPDMLRRSIPGYESIIAQSALLAGRFAQPDSHLYDLGSSLGATSIAMRKALWSLPKAQSAGCEIHAIDNSAAMIEESRKVIAEDALANHLPESSTPIKLHAADLQTYPLQQASVVAMNFTLQFIDVSARAQIMQTIHDALLPGGALILSEKVCFSDAVLNNLHIEMYHEFKKTNGYSDLEISQKRTALENVLVPDTLDKHRERLQQVGFDRSTVWFQCFNFASIVAIK